MGRANNRFNLILLRDIGEAVYDVMLSNLVKLTCALDQGVGLVQILSQELILIA
ncbi:hypothetical protein FBY13_10220 [Pantoea sp. SJZ147]|nr:hypothetical protein FBY13_10220 [Pantoea sp. SJZ147]